MELLRLLGFSVFAAETIISPIPSEVLVPHLTLPQVISPFAPQLVLGAQTEQPQPTLAQPQEEPIQAPLPSVFPTVTKELPTPTTQKTTSTEHLAKKSYVIGLFGDSMIDTLGETSSYLASLLTQAYPQANFIIKNYGVGATTIEVGKNHLINSYTKGDKTVSAVLSDPPDILVIESFAYNPVSGVEKHWLALAEILDTVRTKAPQTNILLATTIAPHPTSFASGAPGITFTQQERLDHVQTISKLLENTIAFAKSENIPLANAYTPSKGTTRYTNQSDNIHYSDAGKQFMSQVIFDSLQKYGLFD